MVDVSLVLFEPVCALREQIFDVLPRQFVKKPGRFFLEADEDLQGHRGVRKVVHLDTLLRESLKKVLHVVLVPQIRVEELVHD